MQRLIESVLANSFFDIEGVANPVVPHIINPKEARQILIRCGFMGGARCSKFYYARPSAHQGKKVSLVWKKNIQTPNGLPTGYGRIVSFAIRFANLLVFLLDVVGSPDHKNVTLWGEYTLVSIIMLMRLRHGPSTSSLKVANGIGETGQTGLTKTVTFDAPFQPNENYRFQFPSGFTDDEGQVPHESEDLPMGFQTGNYPPWLNFRALWYP